MHKADCFRHISHWEARFGGFFGGNKDGKGGFVCVFGS